MLSLSSAFSDDETATRFEAIVLDDDMQTFSVYVVGKGVPPLFTSILDLCDAFQKRVVGFFQHVYLCLKVCSLQSMVFVYPRYLSRVCFVYRTKLRLKRFKQDVAIIRLRLQQHWLLLRVGRLERADALHESQRSASPASRRPPSD